MGKRSKEKRAKNRSQKFGEYLDSQSFCCFICTEEFSTSTLHFSCYRDRSQDHCMCLPCFQNYVNHCLETAFTQSTVPIRCPLPDCGIIVPEYLLATLLKVNLRQIYKLPNSLSKDGPFSNSQLQVDKYGRDMNPFQFEEEKQEEDASSQPIKVSEEDQPEMKVDDRMDLWIRYEKIALGVGLLESKEDVAITCPLCGEYAEIYSGGNKNEQSVSVDPAVIEELESKLRIALQASLQKLEGNHRKKTNELFAESSALESKMAVIADRESVEYKELADTLEKMKQKIKADVEAMELVKKKEILELEGYFGTMMQITVSQLKQKNDGQTENVAVLKGGTKSGKKKKVEIKAKKKKTGQVDLSKVVKQTDSNSLWKQFVSDFEEVLEPQLKLVEVSESTRFFECKKIDCFAIVCIFCQKLFDKRRDEFKLHCCTLRKNEEDVYREILETLAMSSSRSCPKCKYPGLKDLACTHISCEKCQTRWCYSCGRSETETGDFSLHNQWTKETPAGKDVCPMYLHQKYDPDSATALKKFHLELQRQAIDRLQARTDEELWKKVTASKFPDGIFGKSDEEFLRPPDLKPAEENPMEEKELIQ